MTSNVKRRLGIIGYGNIGKIFTSVLADNIEKPLDQAVFLVRERYLNDVRHQLIDLSGRLAIETSVVSDVDSLLALNPSYIVECAAHSAIRAYGARVLSSGRDLFVVSTGALSDDALRKELNAAADIGNAQLILVAGAIGGIDLLGAATLSGIDEVFYTSRKPPKAWLGTPAEREVNLADTVVETVFFEGSAREAALNYPQNANVAGTIALAGIGLDATRVRLIADPTLTANVHEIAVRSRCVNYSVRIEGNPSPINPKTSLSAAYSLAYEVLNRLRRQVI